MSAYQTELDMIKADNKKKENEAVGKESIANLGSTGKGMAQALQTMENSDAYQTPKPISLQN